MDNKVLLILVDGLRPDAIPLCGDPGLETFFKAGTYCLKATTTFPPVTLPCHMSLFHSVDPGRHGTTTNVFAPQVRPIKGLVELLAENNKKSGFVYTWEELRDICTPGEHLEYSWFMRQYTDTLWELEHKATAAAKSLIHDCAPDFLFLYLGGTDEWGHRKGWMSKEYLDSVKNAWDCIQEICKDLPEEYSVIVTADHGGHDRDHGKDVPEDMTIPITFHGKDFPEKYELDTCNIRDIAPTIVELLALKPDEEWEGSSVIPH